MTIDKERNNIMKTIGGWNSENMFFLTRDGDIEITTFGYPKCENGGLYHYYRQGIDVQNLNELDEFGRNRIDRQFIRLCGFVFGYLMNNENTFQSLSCKKVGDQFVARLELTGMTLEYELEFMVELIEKMCSAGGNNHD